MIIRDIGLQFSFFVASLSRFGIRVMVASQNEFGSLPSAIFWKSFSKIGVTSSLNFWQNSAVKPSGHGLLFAGRFLITVSISLLVMGLLRSSISFWFSFGKLYFSKNLSISSKLSILLAQSCWQQSLMIFVFQQMHNFIQNWTKDAHAMWATQAQRDEDIQDEIQELEQPSNGLEIN